MENNLIPNRKNSYQLTKNEKEITLIISIPVKQGLDIEALIVWFFNRKEDDKQSLLIKVIDNEPCYLFSFSEEGKTLDNLHNTLKQKLLRKDYD